MDVHSSVSFARAVEEAAEAIHAFFSPNPLDVAVVLGSGLGGLTAVLPSPIVMPYSSVPHMPRPTVSGHAGQFVYGRLGGLGVLCLAGRTHAYEGKDFYLLTFTTLVLARLGTRLLIATNAAGGGVPGMLPGSVMVLSNHFNMWTRDPLGDIAHCHLRTSSADKSQQKSHTKSFIFSHLNPDRVYDAHLTQRALDLAARLGLPMYLGDYWVWPGPTYETPAEVAFGVTCGAGAFGMSTVPETLCAAACGMAVLGMSFCTNMAAGLTAAELTHEEVKQVAEEAGPAFVRFMKEFLTGMEEKDLPARREYKGKCEEKEEGKSGEGEEYALPLARGKQATEAEVRAAAEKVGPAHSLLVVAGWEDDRNGEGFAWTELPGAPDGLAAALNVRLVARDGVLRVCAVPAEGLRGADAVYVSRVAHYAGVSRALLAFPVQSALEGAQLCTRTIYWMSDALEFCPIQATAPESAVTLHYAAPLVVSPFAAAPTPATAAPQSYTPGVCDSYPHSLLTFPSVVVPNAPARRVGRLTGAQFVASASLAVAYALAPLGVQCHAAGFAPEYEDKKSTVACHENGISNGKPEGQKKFTEIQADACARPDQRAFLAGKWAAWAAAGATAPPKMSILPSFSKGVRCERVGGENPPLPVLQGNVDAVRAGALALRARLGGAATRGLVLFEDGVLGQKFYDIFSESVTGIRPEVELGVRGGWVVGRMLTVAGGFSMEESGMAVRVAREAGITRVVLVARARFASAHRSGSVSIVREHVNLSGRNPLYGPNVDAWGLRFPDQSKVYDRALLRAIVENKNWEKNAERREVGVTVAYVGGPVFNSALLDGLLRVSGADAAVGAGVPEAIVALHGRMECASIVVAESQAPQWVHSVVFDEM